MPGSPLEADDPRMTHRSQTLAHLTRAVALALALSLVAGIPAPTSGPTGTGFVQSADAATYVRVSSLRVATRVTNIMIPRLHISMTIRQGVLGGTISTRYAYHYPATSWPGGHSNTYLYAHGQAGAFLNLRYAHVGYAVILRLASGKYVRYRVTRVVSVAWNDLRWLRPTSTDRLTLQTCLGRLKTSRRLIVIAVPAY
jgi:LPXTG-site transpeptidase (sortase) family protein